MKRTVNIKVSNGHKVVGELSADIRLGEKKETLDILALPIIIFFGFVFFLCMYCFVYLILHF